MAGRAPQGAAAQSRQLPDDMHLQVKETVCYIQRDVFAETCIASIVLRIGQLLPLRSASSFANNHTCRKERPVWCDQYGILRMETDGYTAGCVVCVSAAATASPSVWRQRD